MWSKSGRKLAIFLFLLLTFCAAVCQSGRIQSMKNRLKKVNTPYITLFANDYHRGAQYVETLMHGCKNLPAEYSSWASSANTHNRCVDVCTEKDCEGKCTRLYPSNGVNTDTSLRLSLINMNDQIVSLKSCYIITRRG